MSRIPLRRGDYTHEVVLHEVPRRVEHHVCEGTSAQSSEGRGKRRTKTERFAEPRADPVEPPRRVVQEVVLDDEGPDEHAREEGKRDPSSPARTGLRILAVSTWCGSMGGKTHADRHALVVKEESESRRGDDS